MAWLRALAVDAGGIAWGNRRWMVWNSILAVVPAVLAPFVFRRRARRGVLWLVGLVVFVLFLPNAPYVVTDLVHLRADVDRASSDAAVYAGVLPLYLGFIAIGLVSYALCLREVGAWLRASGRASWVGATEVALHGLSAVGVLLGRVARLNSWEPLASPRPALDRSISTLTWRASPIVLVALFVVIWVGHAATRALVLTFVSWLDRLRSPFRRPAPAHPA